ncbi:ATP-binding protein [Kitasatospora sp. NPDC002040]|uniref:ATP-binding protein n=1 Tax=Kitasatospora sp. NPDC002040 TaxID=3154661 RepID=UPI0033294DB6
MGQPPGDLGQEPLRLRTGDLVSGELLLSIGSPDGSEAQTCPVDWQPHPRRITADPSSRTVAALGPSPAVGPLALGSGASDLPLLDREADVAQLLGLLAEGRSIRLVGQAGAGRSALLAAVADAAGELAPDGVVRLSGHRRTTQDLLQDLYAATHRAPPYRPNPYQLGRLLGRLGAVVVIDDVETHGPELEQLLATAPDCAFLISVAPGSPLLEPGSRLEDHPVAGLARPACLALITRLAGRPLDEAERAWAVDLWFESEGLPLRFVQAAALLRQRDAQVDTLVAAHEDRSRVFGLVKEIQAPDDPAVLEDELRRSVPLPTVAETAAPAARLAAGLSEPARGVLRLALALDGECPTAPHLPALIDVGLGESALHELTDCGLAVSIGGHHRLTDGVREELAEAWPPGEIAYGAAQHFSWWVGHSSVTPAQIAAEAEVVISALLADRDADRPEQVLQLATAAAPAFALSLRWGAWEQTLRIGLEAARALGAAAEEAWFHHELGVLAFCTGAIEQAAGELEAAVALRAALGQPRGTAAARRMLELLRTEAGRPVPGVEPTPVARRPVIRAIAAQVPFRFRTTPGTGGGTRRTVMAASAAVLALGVLGTAVGLSLARTDPEGSGGRGGVVNEDGYTGDLNIGTRSASPSPSATPSAPVEPSETAEPSPSSSRTSRKPSASRSESSSATTRPPTQSPAAPTTKPPAPVTTPPVPPSSSPATTPPVTASPTDTGTTPP